MALVRVIQRHQFEKYHYRPDFTVREWKLLVGEHIMKGIAQNFVRSAIDVSFEHLPVT
jgi:hypothetical protein